MASSAVSGQCGQIIVKRNIPAGGLFSHKTVNG